MPETTNNSSSTVQRVAEEARRLAQELHSSTSQDVSSASRLERDLGLDSLARAELLLRLEKRFGLRFPERTLMDAETVGDLVIGVEAVPIRAPLSSAPTRSLSVTAIEEAPSHATSFIEVLEWHVATHPQRLHALLCGDDEHEDALSYADLHSGANTIASALRERGLKSGETVALMLPTSRFYLRAFFGIMLAGGIPVPIYPPTRASQIEEHVRRQALILSNAGVVFLITVSQAKWIGSFLHAQVESLKDVLIASDLERQNSHLTSSLHGDIALLQYTSGSTGQPKGVTLTHANLLANIRAMGQVTRANSSDVYVSWLPLYHDMGLIASWLASVYHGIPIVLMSPMTFLARPANWLWAIHRHRGTVSGAPNFAYELCASRVQEHDLEGLDLSSWRIAYNGAEPISPRTLERFAERFSKYGFRREAMMPVYGLAESTVCLTCPMPELGPRVDRIQREPFMTQGKALPADQEGSNVLEFVSCGPPLPDHELRVVGPSGKEVCERVQGRLQFRGPSATSGYFNGAELNRELIRDSWLDSGDLAYVSHGSLYLTGRAKDVIIRAGRNIHPHEVEQAVGDIIGIRKGCVVAFGSPDAALGTERLIVLAETRETDPERMRMLRQQINERCLDVVGTAADDVMLAPPHTVLKTSSGKIRRAANREWYELGGRRVAARSVFRQWARIAFAAMGAQSKRWFRNTLRALYALYSWSVFSFLGTLTWIAVMIMPSVHGRWRVARGMARTALHSCAIPFSLTAELPMRVGAKYVAVCNHESYIDSVLIMATWPEPVRFVAKAELQRNLIVSALLRRLGVQFVARFDSQQGVEDARRLSDAARAGPPLLFFPEGTFRRVPGLLPFHMGAFIVAAQSGLPVLPIALRGTRSVLPSGSWVPHPSSLEVRVCAEIEPQETGWESAVRLRETARVGIQKACGLPMSAATAPDPAHRNELNA